jgi:FkbM family methyltransferase
MTEHDFYKSQYGQDKLLNDWFFKSKKNGIFVDIGAHDGISFSNTYYYEKILNWSGLCIEANPKLIDSLREKRNCIVFEGCAFNENCTKKFRTFEGTGRCDMVSGLVEFFSEEHLSFIGSEELSHFFESSEDIVVECFNTSELLINHNLYKVDFLSLDVEGCELEIIKSIDYSKIVIDVILIENQYDNIEIRTFLKDKNYQYMGKTHVDDLFVLKGTYIV